MLSTQYRLRLEGILQKTLEEEGKCSLEDMIWAEKLSKQINQEVMFLVQARRIDQQQSERILS